MSKRTRRPWAGVNKCVVCGTKLAFQPSVRKDAKEYEGRKMCKQNHALFSVNGAYDGDGEFHYVLYMDPQ